MLRAMTRDTAGLRFADGYPTEFSAGMREALGREDMFGSFFVHRSVVEEFGEKFSKKMSELQVGNGAVAGTDVGPLIEQKGLELIGQVAPKLVAQGARLVVLG